MKRIFSLAVSLLLFCLIAAPLSGQSTVGISENFDNTSGTSLPTGWAYGSATATGNYRWISDANGYTGRCVKFNSTSGNRSGRYCYLLTPAVNLTSGSWQVRFMYKNPNGGNFSIFLSTDGGSTYTTDISGGGLPNTGVWTEHTIELSSYLGTAKSNVKIAFKGTSNAGTTGDPNIYLDDVEIELVPTCKKPTSLNIGNVTPSSADLSWALDAKGGTPSHLELYVLGANNDTAYSDYNISGTLTQTSITGLQPNTTYTAYILSNCQDSSLGVSKKQTVTFTTLCSSQNLPYVENYDQLSTLPSCGFYYSATLNNNYSATSGGKSVHLNATSTENAFILFPGLAIRNDSVECSVKLRGNSSSAVTYKIGVVYDLTDVIGSFSTLTQGQIAAGSTGWQEIVCNSSNISYKTRPCYIGVMAEAGAYTSLYVDEVDLHTIPTCVMPANLQLTGNTHNSATLSWTSTATSFVVEIKNGSTITTQNATASPYTVTGLQSNTTYSFRVKAVCGVGDESRYTTNSVSCKTYCAPLSGATLSEGAESTTGDNLPTCWMNGYNVMPQEAETNPYGTQNNMKHSGNRAFYLKGQSGNNSAWLSSLGFTVPTSNAYQLRIWVYRDNTVNANDGLQLFIGTTPGDLNNASLVGQVPLGYSHIPAEAAEGWFDYVFPISRTGICYLMVLGNNSNSHSPIYFDDIAIEPIPTCQQPKSVILGNPSDTTCSISWAAGGSETQWSVTYQLTSNGNPVSSNTVVVNQPSYTFTGLQPSTHYEYNVDIKAICNAQDTSAARNATGSFDTKCVIISTFPYTEDFENPFTSCHVLFNACTYNYCEKQLSRSTTLSHSGSYSLKGPGGDQDATSDDYPSLVLPLMDFSAPGAYEVDFWMYRDNSEYCKNNWVNEGFRFYLSSSSNSLTDTTFLGFISCSMSVAPTENTPGWYEYSFSIPSTVTGQKHLVVVFDSEYGRHGYVDDITVRLAPSCSRITATVTPSYTTADVVVSDTTATEWQIKYRNYYTTSVSTIDTVTGSNSYLLTGLDANAEYEYQVRRVCPDTMSDWSSMQYFHTLEIPDTLPYITSFEDATDNAKWVMTTNASSNFIIGADAGAVSDGTQALYVSYDSYSQTYGYDTRYNSQAYATRLFHFDGGEYNISFKWKCTGGEISSDSLTIYDFGRVFLAPGATTFTGGSVWKTFASYEHEWPDSMIPFDPEGVKFMAKVAGDANGWNTMSRAFNMTGREGDYKIVFMWNNESGGEEYPLAIDELRIIPVSCARPDIIISNLKSDEATLALSRGNQYHVVVSTTPIDVFDSIVTGDIADTIITASTLTLNGLTANTKYYYTALSICDSTTISEWMTPGEFVTECLKNVPYSESFENVAVMDCWSSTDANRIERTTTKAQTGVASLKIDNTIAISPELDIDSISSYILTGWLYSTTATTVNIGAMVDPTDVGSYDVAKTETIPAYTWYEFNADFTLFKGSGYESIVKARHFTIGAASGTTILADGLYFGPTPVCPKPTSPVITDTVHNGFTMTWTDETASEWIVKVAPTAGGDEMSQIVNTQSINFTGLTEQTEYSITLAAICGSGDTSLYIPCAVLTTPVYVPTCQDPAKLPVVEATTMTTITVSSAEDGIYSIIEFAYGPANSTLTPADCNASVFTTTGQAVIQGLSAQLDYNIWYRGVCEPGDTSRWSGMATGRTTYSNWFMPQNPHVVGYPEATTTIAWGGCPEATKYEYELTGDTTITGEVTVDTVTLTGLSVATTYNFKVRAINDSVDTTAWVNLQFKTISEAAIMPYVCDFESTTENNNWTLINNSQANYFTIGSIDFDYYGGNPDVSTALYVTNNGTTAVYTSTPSTVYATRTMSMMAGKYTVQYNWMCAGEPGYNVGQAFDYPRVFLAPVMMQFTAGTVADGINYDNLPEGCISLEDGYHLTQALSKRQITAEVIVPYTGIYNLVVFWTNDNSTQYDPAIMMDNITIYPQQCVAPTATVASVGQTTANIAVENYSLATSSIMYSLSYGTRAEAFLTDTMAQADTIKLTGLTIGTGYNLYVASTCAGYDESLWTKVSFRTNCGTIDIPYEEGFEHLDYFYSAPGMINSICWTDLNAGSYYNDYPNYRAATSGSQVTEGFRSLQLNGSTTKDLYLVLPAMTDPTNAQMAFDIAYESTTSCGIVYAGYMTDPSDASTFTSVLTTQRSTDFTRVNAIYGSIPATAHLAFKYAAGTDDGASAYIDNLRVSKVVSGPTYNEYVCYSEGYSAHGFNVPASQLSVGLNTLTRIAEGNPGCPDTVITANVTMRSEYATNYYDTICSGVSYSKYGFTIASPISSDYTRSGISSTGCDSTTYLHLYVIPSTEVEYDTICNGSSKVFHDLTLTEPGTYTTTYQNVKGCTISATLHLYVDATTHNDYQTICKGESYTWNNQTYNQTGVYAYSGTSKRGCQVNDTLHLYVLDGDTSYSVQICTGKSYYFIDTLITTAGTYKRTFIDPFISCTVTHTLTVTEVAGKSEDVYDRACEGKPYNNHSIQGVIITGDTTFIVQTKAMDMCDSVARIHVTMIPTIEVEINKTIKKGESYTFDDNTLTKPGDYYATFTSKEGCDSNVTLHLSVVDGIESVVDVHVELVPNPINSGEVAMIYGNFGEIEKVEVVNNFGQVIESFVPASYPIEVSSIGKAGIYYVRLITEDGGVYVEKLIVK